MTSYNKIIDEIHQIRADIHREDEGLTSEERADKMNQEANRIMDEFGLNLRIHQKAEKRDDKIHVS